MKAEEKKVGKALVRVQPQKTGFAGIVIHEGKIKARRQCDDVDELWRQLSDDAARLDPSCFGFDGARVRFRRMMPDGFAGKQFAS